MLDARYTCVVCSAIAYHPVVHDCSAWLCMACSMTRKTCPLCDEEMEGKLKPVTAKPILAKLALIEVKCPVCGAIFKRDTLCSHIPECPIECPMHCGMKVAPRSQLQHEQTECLSVPVVCDICGDHVIRRSLKDLSHKESDCPINCPNGCGEKVRPRVMEEHQKACSRVTVKCCAQPFCTWSGPKCHYDEHIQSCTIAKLNPIFGPLVNENKRLKEMFSNLEIHCNEEILRLSRLCQQLETDNRTQAAKLTQVIAIVKAARIFQFTSLDGRIKEEPTTVGYSSPFQMSVTLSGGIQRWIVPFSGMYKFTAIGASGGDAKNFGAKGGRGAVVTSFLAIEEGAVIAILVGQGGETRARNGGGGGGTFVWEHGSGNILICAGGGGGGSTSNGQDASLTRNGTHGNRLSSGGGTGGGGGEPQPTSMDSKTGPTIWAGGGAGWISNGCAGSTSMSDPAAEGAAMIAPKILGMAVLGGEVAVAVVQ
ncbi:hypothetical protein Pelo_8144 [Pelomyxa schiedti]|nr:hypothetical protein Pelo_12200 [Pelomyxa schiedti]KAH3760068.1 hypothetical protein Pelo_8144 [Pelomyxa schiedti]